MDQADHEVLALLKELFLDALVRNRLRNRVYQLFVLAKHVVESSSPTALQGLSLLLLDPLQHTQIVVVHLLEVSDRPC